MLTEINHKSSLGGYSSLIAIPISGKVRVQVLSGSTLIGETTTNSNGEWQSSISVQPGTYTIRFLGLFHPIGKDRRSRYQTTTNQVDISVTIEEKQSIEEISVDLWSNQTINGRKKFTNVSIEQLSVNTGLLFPKSKIYENGTGLTFQEGSLTKSLTDLSYLQRMNDVVATPESGHLFYGTGDKWASSSAEDLGILTLNADQTVSGLKTFQQHIVSPALFLDTTTRNNSGSLPGITLADGEIYLSDSSGTYSLSDLRQSELDTKNTLSGNVLVADGTSWTSMTADEADLVTISGTQTITGFKTFTDTIVFNGPIVGDSIICDFAYASAHNLVSSICIKQYIDDRLDSLSIAGAVTLTGAQTITGIKTFSNGFIVNTSITGTAIDTDFSSPSNTHIPSTLAVKTYVDSMGSTDIAFNDSPAESPDGVISSFTMSYAMTSGSVMLFLNGQLLTEGVSSDYVVSGNTVTFNAGCIPQTSDIIVATYLKS